MAAAPTAPSARRSRQGEALRSSMPTIELTTRRVRLTLGVADADDPIGRDVTSPAAAAPIARAAIGSEIAECIVVIFLNARNRVTGYSEVARGTVNAARPSPKDVLIPALYANAHSIVLAHNHQSGDPTPSRADHSVTAVLRDAGRLIGITVVDHLIVIPDRHFSFAVDQEWAAGDERVGALHRC
jgi:DNA repair protein RadC